MKIARMLSPVHSLGPGERVCLWTQGCSRRCPGCISPELQSMSAPEADEALLADILLRTAESGNCGGLTVSGGDPFDQPEALLRLLKLVRGGFEDILVYTGYELARIRDGVCGQAGVQCLEYIDVLIDGPYMEERNTPECVLRGSDNQVIHFLDPSLKPVYEGYMEQGRVLETFSHNDTMIITGIPNRRD